MDGMERRARQTVLAGIMAACMASGAASQPADAVFRIGMVAVPGEAPVVEGLSHIRQAFSRALGRPVEVIAARDYEALIEAHIGERIDYAIYSASAYAAATIRCGCLRPVVSPLGERGAVGVRSVLVARRGAQVQTVALGPADSLTGRLAPDASWPQAAEMARNGGLVFAGSATEAEAMFLDGSVDGLFGWIPAPDDAAAPVVVGTLSRLDSAGLGRDDIEVVWQSQMLRHGPHAVRADAPFDTVVRLQQMLAALGPENEEVRAALDGHYGHGFATASPEDYEPLVSVLEAVRGGGETP